MKQMVSKINKISKTSSSQLNYKVEFLKKVIKSKINLQKNVKKSYVNSKKQIKNHDRIVLSLTKNKRYQELKYNQKGKQYLQNDNKQQILGGGCGPSRTLNMTNPEQIYNKKKKTKLNERFLENYNYYTDKSKVAENIEQQNENQMQVEIFKNCIFEYKIEIRENIQLYKNKLYDLIEIFQVYILSGEGGLMSKELKQLGEDILEMKKSFEIVSQSQPTLDLAFYFDILYKLNSCREGIDKNNSKLPQVANFILQIIKVGSAAFKGDFGEILALSQEIGKNLLQIYKNSKAKQLFSHILDIHIKKVKQFEKELWNLTLVQQLEFYIEYFCELSNKQEQQTDFVLIILVKINYYFSLADQNDFVEVKKKFPLSNDLIQKFLAKVIQKVGSKHYFENSIINEFYAFSIQDPTFRFLTISILLKYYQIISDQSDSSNNKDDTIVYLIYKYLCEKSKKVKLAYETNTQFEIIYNKKIKDTEFMKQIEEMSKKRRNDFQTIFANVEENQKNQNSQKVINNNIQKNKENIQNSEDNPINQENLLVISKLENFEERIDNQVDLERLIANKIIEKWERDVELRQNEKIAQKDDVLIEVKDLYIQQSITYEKGNIKLKRIIPSKQQIDDQISDNQSQKALYIIINNFLLSDQYDKNTGIKEYENKDSESNMSHNKLKILGILAEGGTGKSMLIKKLETVLIDNQDIYKNRNVDYIPLLIKCNSLDPDEPCLDQYLLAQGIDQNKINILKGSDRNKVILLDGYDEYTGQYFRVYSKLKLKDWKNTKVIVTTRREKLSLKEACFNFSIENENGQIDESSFCLMKLEEFNEQDIIEYCKRYFKQHRIHKVQEENEKQISKDLNYIKDCMKNHQLENLLYLPINLYLFTRMMVDVESEQEVQKIKQNISDQVGIQEIFFKEQFKREAQVFVQQEKIDFSKNNQKILENLTNCYFEYFQTIAMKMFLNKGKKEIVNFLQLQKDQIHFSLRKDIQKELSSKQQDNLIQKIKEYVNSKIITRVKDANSNRNKIKESVRQVIEFKHKSLFEYFAARAMKYDFDIHQNNIFNLSIKELQEFSINKKSVMNAGQNQSEQQILLKLYKLIKNEIESKEFQQNYYDDKIEKNNRYIQYLKRSTLQKQDEISQIDIGASNLLSTLFISKFSYSKLHLTLCSFSKVYISNPKSIDINFDRCNFNNANLQNSCINFDSCNTQTASFDAFSKVFDTQNIYSFNRVIWGGNDQLYSISNSGFINSFKVVDSKIQLQNSKQLSQTPLFQIVKISDEDFLVSSEYSLFLINSKNFEIKQTHKFKESIQCITMIKESIVVNFLNKSLFHGTFKDGFKQLKIIGYGSIYNQKLNILITHEKDTFQIWDTLKNFELVNTIQGHTDQINSVAFSADGKYLATGSWDKTCKIWNAEKGFELINTIKGHTSNINSVAFSADGKYLATCSSDSICKTWNAEKGFELINTIQGHTSNINSVAFSADGKYIATGSRDNTCKIWNAEKGFELINTIQGHTSYINSVAFSADGKYLATGSLDSTCKTWNAQKGFELINTIQGHTKTICSVAYSADGKYLATGSWDKTCKIWNAEKGFQLINTIQGHTDQINSVAFSADGKYLATGSQDNTCKIWNAEKGFELINTIQGHTSNINSVAFSADGKYLATGSQDKTCQIWNAEKGFELINTIKGHTSDINSVAFSADGKYLATGSQDITCKIWNAEKGFELINTIQGHTSYINSVAFSADGKYLATGSSDSTCKIWNAEKGFELINTIQGHADMVNSVAFSTDGKYLATCSRDNTCKTWNAEKGFELINTIQGHTSNINSVAFSADGKYLATGSWDNTCKVWNAEKGFELINTIQGHTDLVNSVAFSADGKYLATGSEDKTCKIWNAEKGFELINTIQGLTSFNSVAFSADGKYLATGSSDSTCKIWNSQKGFELINTIQGLTSNINSVAFSGDGKYLAGSSDSICKIWNAEKGFELINTIKDHNSYINSVAFSADGKYLATGSRDNTCKIWNTEKGFQLINTIEGLTSFNSVAFSADGKYLATGSQDSTCKIWYAEKGFELINIIQGHTFWVNSVAFSVDGKYLATGSKDNTCKIWNAEKGFELINTIQSHTSNINSVAFSADGKYIITEQNDKSFNIFDLQKFEKIENQKNVEELLKKNKQELNQNYSLKEMKLFENMFIL